MKSITVGCARCETAFVHCGEGGKDLCGDICKGCFFGIVCKVDGVCKNENAKAGT